MPIKFPRQIIVNIRRQYAIGHTIKELSAAYDFNEKTIRGIVHGQTYKNVVISPHELSRPVPNLPLTQSQRERQQRYIGRRAKGSRLRESSSVHSVTSIEATPMKCSSTSARSTANSTPARPARTFGATPIRSWPTWIESTPG